jgi:hypothetical protein
MFSMALFALLGWAIHPIFTPVSNWWIVAIPAEIVLPMLTWMALDLAADHKCRRAA